MKRLSKLQKRILTHLLNVEMRAITEIIKDFYGSKKTFNPYQKDFLSLQSSIYRSLENLRKKGFIEMCNNRGFRSGGSIRLTKVGREKINEVVKDGEEE